MASCWGLHNNNTRQHSLLALQVFKSRGEIYTARGGIVFCCMAMAWLP